MQTSHIHRVQLAAWLAVVTSVAAVAAVAAVSPDIAVILALTVPLLAASGVEAYAEREGAGDHLSGQLLSDRDASGDRDHSPRPQAKAARERAQTGSFPPGFSLRDSVPPGLK